GPSCTPPAEALQRRLAPAAKRFASAAEPAFDPASAVLNPFLTMKTHHKGQMTVARSFAPTSAANVGKGASRLVAARLGPIWRAYWLSPPVGPGPISDRRSLLPEPTSAARSHSATGNERAVR